MATALTSPTKATGLELVPLRSRSAVAPLPLRPGRHTLGSDSACDLCLAFEGVAPQHCLIIAGPQKTIIKALSPLTWINDGAISESALRPGDRLIVGPVELLARAIPSASEDEDREEEFEAPIATTTARMPSVSRERGTSPAKTAEPLPPSPLPPPLPTAMTPEVTAAVISPLPPPLPLSALLPPPVPPAFTESEKSSAGLREQERLLAASAADTKRAQEELDRLRHALGRESAALADVEQERRLLAKKLDELLTQRERETDLAAELERERTRARGLHAELEAVREAAGNAVDSSEELETLRREVESLTQRLATVRITPLPEENRSGLLQQRTELLAVRRDLQEKLAEQHRMQSELEEGRRALLQEAETFRQQQIAVHDELTRVEQQMTELDERHRVLAERERTLQNGTELLTSRQAGVAEQAAALLERETALSSQRQTIAEERARLEQARIDAEDLQRRQDQLAARETELDQVAEQLEQELRQLELSSEQHVVTRRELDAYRREIGQREETVRDQEAAVSRLRAEVEAVQKQFGESQEVWSERVREIEHREQESLAAASHATGLLESHEQEVARFESRLASLDERERRLLERAAEQEQRAQALAQAELDRAAARGDEERLTLHLGDIESRTDELRQQEAALAEARAFIASRERAIEARLVDLEQREARLTVAAAAPSPAAAVPQSFADLPSMQSLDQELEAARLNAESLAQRERDVADRYDSLKDRERMLDEQASSLRQRELAVEAREEDLETAVPVGRESGASLLEQELRQKLGELESEKESLDGLKEELKQHRAAFLEQYQSLEQERSQFYADRQSLDDELVNLAAEQERLTEEQSHLVNERTLLANERELFEADRQRFTAAPAAGVADALHSLPFSSPFPSSLLKSAESPEPNAAPFPPPLPSPPEAPSAYSSPFRPSLSSTNEPLASVEEEAALVGRFLRETLGRPFPSMAEKAPAPPSNDEDEPSSLQDSLLTTVLDEPQYGDEPQYADEVPAEEELAAEAPPEVQSSDALELRAHLADLFGIDLSSRRRSTEPSGSPGADSEDASAPEPAMDRGLFSAPARHEERRSSESRIIEPSEAPAPRVEAPAEPEVSYQDDDVASYMERLLKRTRSGAAEPPRPVAPPPPPPVVVEAPKPVVHEPEPEDARPVRRPLQKEERDAIRGSMDSFRELANRTARAAVARHQLVKLRQVLSTKGMLAGFCAVVTVILIVPELWGSDRYRYAALGCICVTSIAGLEWLRTKVRIRKLDEFVAESDISKDPPLESMPGDAPGPEEVA